VKQVRIPTLLLAAILLLVVWHLIGGRNEIAWYESVRSAKAQGWDLSQADRGLSTESSIMFRRTEFSFF
jgi:hypothetical protein